jgi:hypothetical protein
MDKQRADAFQPISGSSSQRDGFVANEVRYRGCRIVWDARRAPGMLFWTGKVVVVTPTDAANIAAVHRVYRSDYFLSEEDARDHLIGAAKHWIDDLSETGSPQGH